MGDELTGSLQKQWAMEQRQREQIIQLSHKLKTPLTIIEGNAELLAEEVDADALLILTEVEKVAINFGTPDQKDLGQLSLSEAARYAAEGQFGVGSMLPKVEAAMKFVRANPGKKAIITSLDKCLDALDGKTGTVITFA